MIEAYIYVKVDKELYDKSMQKLIYNLNDKKFLKSIFIFLFLSLIISNLKAYAQNKNKEFVQNNNSNLVIRFKDIKNLLLNNNKVLIQYRSQKNQSEAMLKSKISAWYPKLNLNSNDLPSFNTGQTKNSLSTDTSTNKFIVGLNGIIEWDIIKPERRLEINIAKNNLENSKLNYQFIKRDLYLEAVKTFFLIQASIQDIKIAEKAIEISKTALIEAKNKFQAGIGNRLEVLEAETQLGRDKINLSRKNGQLNFNKNSLSRILDLNYEFKIDEKDNSKIFGFWDLDKSQSLELALNNRNDLKIKQNNILINKLQGKSVLSGKKPKFTLYNNYSISNANGESGVSSINYDNITNSSSNTLGMKFELNLFDGGLTKQNFINFREKEDQLIAELTQNKIEIENEIKNTLINIDISKENMIISYAQAQSARDSLEISLMRLEAGLTTQRELVNLQGDVSEAESNFINSTTQYNENLMKMVRLIGQDNYNLCNFSNNKKSSFIKYAREKDLFICE